MSKTKENQLITSMNADDESVKILADYLGYTVGKNPVNPNGKVRIFFTDKTDDKDTGVMAIQPVETLTPASTTVDVRKLFEQVADIKDNELTLDFSVPVIGFVGKQRIVFFKTVGGNRDTRLDLNPETIDKDLYLRNLSYLNNNSIKVEESPFGFGTQIIIDEKAFRRELSSSFLAMVSMYRKKLSEWITATSLKDYLYDLVSDKAKFYIKQNDIKSLVQDDSYKSVLSTVVNTLSLRQLMRRFLEGYYGADSFNVDGIALGVGSGTLDEAIERAVTIARNTAEEKQIKKINRHRTSIVQMDLFDTGFTDDEIKATSKVEVKKGQEDYLSELSKKASKQFEIAYGGDLFAGSIGRVATQIDHELAKQNKIDWVKPYIDTKAGNYSFRFEDMPPEAIEKQYEDSMSQNVQINLNKDTNKPEVYFGKDEAEQKTKGAYYTDQRFVEYMVNQTVTVEFQKRYQLIRDTVQNGSEKEIDHAIQHLLDLKIADFTCGGGSFLRGAFLKLADQFQLLNSLEYPEKIKNKYKFLDGSEDSQYQWEDYVLKHMIYGVDVDYQAVIVASLTLTLSTLQHKPKNTKLPQLIGRTLIHQNALINAVPYYKREEVFGKYKKEIARLRKLKFTNFDKFVELRDKLTNKVIPEAGDVASFADALKIGCIEFALPEVYFNEDGSLNVHGGMDIVIGNPPWETWKPSSDDFFAEYSDGYRKLSKAKKKEFAQGLIHQIPKVGERWDDEKKRIKAGADYLHSEAAYRHQTWKINGRRQGSDPNLYKLSLERFIQLGDDHARFSVVVPDSFVIDVGPTALRHLLFDHYHVVEFLSFENYRKQIFRAVHASYKFAVLTFDCEQPRTTQFMAFFNKHSLDMLNRKNEKMVYDVADIKKYEPEKYSLVLAQSPELHRIYDKIHNAFPTLAESHLLEFGKGLDGSGRHNFYRDIGTEDYTIPLYRGKNVDQFTIISEPDRGVQEKFARQCRMGKGFDDYRIIVRDISGAGNKRTMLAMLLPKQSICGDTLNYQKYSDQMNIEDKLFYLGLLNSYALDFIIRNIISTHVNQTFLRQLPMPTRQQIKDSNRILTIVELLLVNDSEHFSDLLDRLPTKAQDEKGRDDLIAELNARVMIDFNLTRQEIITLMKTFESPRHKEDVRADTQRILDYYDKLNEDIENG